MVLLPPVTVDWGEPLQQLRSHKPRESGVSKTDFGALAARVLGVMADVLALPALSVFLARDPLAVFCHALYTSGGDKRGANNLEGRRHCQIHAHPPRANTHPPNLPAKRGAHLGRLLLAGSQRPLGVLLAFGVDRLNRLTPLIARLACGSTRVAVSQGKPSLQGIHLFKTRLQPSNVSERGSEGGLSKTRGSPHLTALPWSASYRCESRAAAPSACGIEKPSSGKPARSTKKCFLAYKHRVYKWLAG